MTQHTDPAEVAPAAPQTREGHSPQTIDAIMRMLRERAEDGVIHITDAGVEGFIQDALQRLVPKVEPQPTTMKTEPGPVAPKTIDGHSPTPWKMGTVATTRGRCHVIVRTDGVLRHDRYGDPRPIASIHEDGDYATEADARYIITAVNAHDALVAALQAIVNHEQIDGVGGGRIRYEFDYNSPIGKQARAALALAQEGEVKK